PRHLLKPFWRAHHRSTFATKREPPQDGQPITPDGERPLAAAQAQIDETVETYGPVPYPAMGE
ncbi:MAG TPA: hypothetical protein VFL82_08765, partial [Thermomicrobiales bacterium]|nr:hypothetical protein [Thermomicrobiales bacterium]